MYNLFIIPLTLLQVEDLNECYNVENMLSYPILPVTCEHSMKFVFLPSTSVVNLQSVYFLSFDFEK